MKNILFLLVISLLLFGCGRKKEEVIVEKKEDKQVVKQNEPSKETAPDTIKEITNETLTSSTRMTKQYKAAEDYVSVKSSETQDKIGVNAVVTGYVADVNVRERVAYLNFDKRYPANTFTAVVFPDKYELFGDLTRFKGKNVEVKGRIGQYKGKPQIILNREEQIKIIGN